MATKAPRRENETVEDLLAIVGVRTVWDTRALHAFDKIQNIFLSDMEAYRDPLKMQRLRALVLDVGEDPEGL